MKHKVLFCVPPNVGGAERVTLTIAKLLDREKYDVKVVIVGRTTGEIKEFVPDYMEIIHVKVRNIWDFTTWRLVNVFKKEKPDVCFCSLMYLNVRVILAAKIVGGIRIVVRNNIAFDRMRFDNAMLIKTLYPRADAIILQTDEMKQEMKAALKIDESKLHVIFNPIDTDSIKTKLKNAVSPFKKECQNYVFVGRIDYVKGLDVLISAFAKVAVQNQNARLFLVGKIVETDSYYQSLKKQIAELKLENYIIWTGFTNNPYQYIKYADCFVLPSRIEGLPNVLLDAMYLQVPVVATRSVPVIDRIVSPDRGTVVDVNDDVALSVAMENAIKMKVKELYESNNDIELTQLF